MRKSLGNKRNEICEPQRDEITPLYGDFTEGEHVRIFDNQDFGFRRITVERPLRLKVSPPSKRIRSFRCYGASKKRKEKKAAEAEAAAGRTQQAAILDALVDPDPVLRDYENVPLKEDVDAYMKRKSPSPCARRLGGRVEDQGRLRDRLQPLLLHIHGTASAGGDRGGTEADRA